MKKRIIGLMVVLSMLIWCVPIIAHAATSGTCGDNVTWTLDDEGTLTISGTGDMENYSYGAYDVPWYHIKNDIKTTIINNGITSIGDYAFDTCEKLTRITIPNSVTIIGNYSFSRCRSLTSITIPDSVTRIGNGAFEKCDSFINLSIPNSVTIIGSGAFFYCKNLISVTISNSVTSIGVQAFTYCGNLTSINVVSSNKNYYSIDGNLFNKNKTELIQYAIGKKDETYIIPDSVTSINDDAFYCSSLTSITIPDSITIIDYGAFNYCNNLKYVYYSGSEEQWKSITIASGNNYLTNATIHYNSTGGTVTPPPTVTFAPTPSTPSPDKGFEVNKYRADFLLKDTLGSTMENTYFNFNNTPSNILYQAVKDSNVLWQANAWKAFSDTIDAVDSPSKLLDYSVEEKDMYSAIIFNMFESATDYKIMQCIDNEAVKETKKLVSTVTSSMKNLYNYDFLNNYDISKMSAAQKANLKKSMSDSFAAEHGNAKDIGKLTSVIGKAIDYGKDLQQCCEMVSSYYQIYMLNDAMKSVMKEMLNKCPIEETALRNALKDCVTIMNAGGEEFANDMVTIFCSVAGKDATQYLIDMMWDKVKDKIYLARPEIYVIMTAYKVGKYASNVIFNVDDITEKLFKLEAMVNSENVLDSAYKSVKSKYKSDKTEEKAEVYNSAIDVMFNALDTDCDYALAYVNSIDSSTAGKINAALGNTSCAEMKKSIGSIQDNYALKHASVLTGWIYELENDYPDLYPQYEPLIDETYSKYVKKYEINCPVDVYIYDTNGNLEGSVINNAPYCSDDKNITISVNNDAKTVYLYDDKEYNIVYEGNDTGTMDIAITEYDENQNEARNVYFNDLILEKGTTYSSSDNANVQNYVVSNKNNTAINSDYDTNDGGNTYTVSLERGYFEDFAVSAELHEGEHAQIRAYVPDGYKFVGWTSDAGEDIFEDASSSTTRIKMPTHNVNITANIVECPRLVLSDITSSSVTVTARACEDINSGTVILAIYDNNDILKNVITKDFKQEIIFDNLNLNDCTVKAMLWDNINTMKPLAYMAKQ